MQRQLSKNIRRAGCIVICGNELLIVHQRSSGYWGFPKGSLDADEDPVAGAIRECHEETGVIIIADDLLPMPLRCKESVFFIAIIPSKPRLWPSDWEEISECGWMTVDQLKSAHISVNTRILIGKIERVAAVGAVAWIPSPKQLQGNVVKQQLRSNVVKQSRKEAAKQLVSQRSGNEQLTSQRSRIDPPVRQGRRRKKKAAARRCEPVHTI